MGESRAVPLRLRMVAHIFMVFGTLDLAYLVFSLSGNRLYLSLGILMLPTGLGLVWLKPAWRSLALIFLCIFLLGSGIVMILAAVALIGGVLGMDPFGIGSAAAHTEVSHGWEFILGFLGFTWLNWWEYRVLTEPEIAGLFRERRARRRSGLTGP